MVNQEIVSQKLSPTSVSELLADVDEHIYSTLKNSIYPGAKDESIAMVISYCKAKKYDPLGRTCHIVPMNVKNSKTGNYEWRDVILPGIAAYRIDGHRTGQCGGVTEPEFGPMITEQLGSVEMTYPEWCKVTVKKIMANGMIVDFTAKEYWKENYAIKGKDKTTGKKMLEPNDVWEKRGRGQLAKCAEAQAWRKAFPEAIGSLPTFEEMEGKSYKVVTDEARTIIHKVEGNNNEIITEEYLQIVKDKILEAEADEMKILQTYQIDCLDNMKMKDWPDVIRLLERQKKKKQEMKNLSLKVDQQVVEEELT